MAASEELRSPDWVFSNNSNISAARDRGWFVDYTPFTSHCGQGYIGDAPSLAVRGIGTVDIPVRLPSNRAGEKHGTLRIRDVLHIPTANCNILGQGDFMNQRSVSFAEEGDIRDQDGKVVACFDEKKPLMCLKLSEPPVGPATSPSMFKPDTMYMISINWPASERARWENVKPYNEDEKAWLKDMFKNEYHFLMQHGLSIHKDEDRAEGRSILRQMMKEDENMVEDE